MVEENIASTSLSVYNNRGYGILTHCTCSCTNLCVVNKNHSFVFQPNTVEKNFHSMDEMRGILDNFLDSNEIGTDRQAYLKIKKKKKKFSETNYVYFG